MLQNLQVTLARAIVVGSLRAQKEGLSQSRKTWPAKVRSKVRSCVTLILTLLASSCLASLCFWAF